MGQLNHTNLPPFFQLCRKKEKAFFSSGISVFAGHLKNAFFHYNPIKKIRQAERTSLPAKNHDYLLLKLRKRSASSIRRN